MSELELKFLSAAYDAAANSPDPRTQNGAVLVDENDQIIGVGCNRFPGGPFGQMAETADRLTDRDFKQKSVVHAENGAVLNAARNGKKTEGSTLYVAWGICSQCAIDTACAGVKEVVCHDADIHKLRPDWKTSIEHALTILTESGVKVRFVEAKLGKTIRFNGELVTV